MRKIRIEFTKCIQDDQEAGSNDESMISRVFFTMHVDGSAVGDFYCDLKQIVGSDYHTSPLEVRLPTGRYKGPFDYEVFRAGVEKYYRSAFGASGTGVGFPDNARQIRMRNNTIVKQEAIEFQTGTPDVAW